MNWNDSSNSLAVSPGNPVITFGPEGRGGHQGFCLCDSIGIVVRTVLTMHAAQDGVGAGLKRRMNVFGNPAAIPRSTQ